MNSRGRMCGALSALLVLLVLGPNGATTARVMHTEGAGSPRTEALFNNHDDGDMSVNPTYQGTSSRSLLTTAGAKPCGFLVGYPDDYFLSSVSGGSTTAFIPGSNITQVVLGIDLIGNTKWAISAYFVNNDYVPKVNKTYFQFYVFQSNATKDAWLNSKASNCKATENGLYWFVKYGNTTATSTLPEGSTVSFAPEVSNFGKKSPKVTITVPIQSPSVPWTWGQSLADLCSHLGPWENPAYLAVRIFELGAVNESATGDLSNNNLCGDIVKAPLGVVPFHMTCNCPSPPPAPSPAYPHFPGGTTFGTIPVIVPVPVSKYTFLELALDGGYGVVNLPFTFSYYCQPYTTVFAAVNGYLTFNATGLFSYDSYVDRSYYEFGQPWFMGYGAAERWPGGVIAGFYHDLVLSNNESLTFASGTGAYGKFLSVQWDAFAKTWKADIGPYDVRVSFQVTLFEDGKIQLTYVNNNGTEASNLRYQEYLNTNGIGRFYDNAFAGLEKQGSIEGVQYNITMAASLSTTACAIFVPQSNGTCATGSYILHASTNGCPVV